MLTNWFPQTEHNLPAHHGPTLLCPNAKVYIVSGRRRRYFGTAHRATAGAEAPIFQITGAIATLVYVAMCAWLKCSFAGRSRHLQAGALRLPRSSVTTCCCQSSSLAGSPSPHSNPFVSNQPTNTQGGHLGRILKEISLTSYLSRARVEDALQTISIQSDTKEHDYVYETVCGSGRECETTLL